MAALAIFSMINLMCFTKNFCLETRGQWLRFSPRWALGFWLIHEDRHNYQKQAQESLFGWQWITLIPRLHQMYVCGTKKADNNKGGKPTTVCCISLLWSNEYHLSFSPVYGDRKCSFSKFQVHFRFFFQLMKKINQIRKQKLWFQNGN